MTENESIENNEQQPDSEKLEAGAYEIIRNRLNSHGEDLRLRLEKLNNARKKTFGSIEPELTGSERITTENNCIPRDMVPLGCDFLFGYNVYLGLRSVIKLEDIFAIYAKDEKGFKQSSIEKIQDKQFMEDLQNLYKYYKNTTFSKFAIRGPHLFFVFQVGKGENDIKTFKWLMNEDCSLKYMDNRSDHEFKFPPQHEFEWTRATRDMFRFGEHPHVSIEDKVFVETVGGDLTIKVEDNTDSGEGIYQEPVDNPDQTLDDAVIYYANLGNLILLKIRPYQEEQFRHIIYSSKVKKAKRIDALENSCVLLPEGHGVIFPNGYYLQTGEYKEFESRLEDMTFEKRISSPNGEDTLYVFYNKKSGVYGLLSYNLIGQKLENPIVCNGFSIFDNGEIMYFKTQDEPQKFHTLQIWQTPFVGPDYVAHTDQDSYLFNIGNRDIVHCMAACNSLLGLIRREDTYEGLYVDAVRLATDIIDTYFWVSNKDAMDLAKPIAEIKTTAASAIDEFEKVLRIKASTKESIKQATQKTREVMNTIRASRFESINEFVQSLAGLRTVRGEIISLRDLRYVDLKRVDELEGEVVEEAENLSQRCVEFLLTEEALVPYHERVQEQKGQIEQVTTVTEAKVVEEDISTCGSELEMLVDIVSNLKIDDATQRTTIIDNISAIYSILNQVRSALKNKIKELASSEGTAEFGSQMKLLNQAVINYLDVCDTPEKSEEYLSKLMVQIEELEGRFSDFEDFVIELTEKREEVYNAFGSRKMALVEERNRRADGLFRSAERVLKGISTRVAGFSEVTEINGYFASDIMIEKVRNNIEQLVELGDSVKADDIQTRLKTIHEDAVRQLKDRKELFLDGENIIRFGTHNFSVNTQPLDLTIIERDSKMFLHLTGTKYTEEIKDEGLIQTKDVWDQEVISENRQVYRAEYLAYIIFCEIRNNGSGLSAEEILKLSEEDLTKHVQQFMGPRYAEGYVKGVHDVDAGKLLRALLDLDSQIGLLRYHTKARALAIAFWHQYIDEEIRPTLTAKLEGFGTVGKYFSLKNGQDDYIHELQKLIQEYSDKTQMFDDDFVNEAGEYLFHAISQGDGHPISPEAEKLFTAFKARIQKVRADSEFSKAVKAVEADPKASFTVLRDWLNAFLSDHGQDFRQEFRDEVAALIFDRSYNKSKVADVSANLEIEEMVGNHATIEKGLYQLDFNAFMLKLRRYKEQTVPNFKAMIEHKKRIIEQAREYMRLDEFKPRVLTSFVRNRLIDQVYLPLVGDNLAKQIGAEGDTKRTDRMGLLMLISPPGYGKTTLMEYIANRLGVTFMKINGPAIGDRVTSIDPAEAPNAAARSEVEKLNLALEMGDNVMIYLDDIQHCNPEFLQKFISLCDAQRKIEGVFKGKTRTYDLRGRKVSVVMAGNPYTESGEKFKVPDMLANRADTYNIGDIIGDRADVFKLSYLENSMTSNPVLSKLATRGPKDIYGIIKIAETGSQEGVDFEGNYSGEEVGEFVSVMKKLLRVRDIILSVNQEYIKSAGQADEYRTEPAFKLQGSYRNMNRIAERILPIMNDEELETLVFSDYENEAQTLTTGAESNLLKFKELSGKLVPEETKRWEDIKKTFNRNQMFTGVGEEDRVGQVVMQLSAFSEGLKAIQETIASAIDKTGDSSEKIETVIAEDTIVKIGKMLAKVRKLDPVEQAQTDSPIIDDKALLRIEEILKNLTPQTGAVETKISDDTLEALEKIFSNINCTAASSASSAMPPPIPGNTSVFSRQTSNLEESVSGEITARAVSPLIKALKDDDKLIRSDAAMALGEIMNRRAVDPLIGMLSDPSDFVRENAASALGQIGDRRAVEALVKATNDPADVVCIKAVKALRKIEDGEGISHLIWILKNDERDAFRFLAAESLGKSRDRSAVQALIKTLLNDSNTKVRIKAAKMLGMIGDKRAAESLEQAKKDPSKKVREAVDSALKQLV